MRPSLVWGLHTGSLTSNWTDFFHGYVPRFRCWQHIKYWSVIFVLVSSFCLENLLPYFSSMLPFVSVWKKIRVKDILKTQKEWKYVTSFDFSRAMPCLFKKCLTKLRIQVHLFMPMIQSRMLKALNIQLASSWCQKMVFDVFTAY